VSKIPTRIYETKKSEKSADCIEANSTVIDWQQSDKMNCKQFRRLDGDLDNRDYLIGYALSVYFRSLFGVVDHADMNFLIDRKNKIFYSVDEENINMEKESNFSKLKKHFKEITDNWDDIGPEIQQKLKYWKNQKGKVKELLSDELYEGYKRRFEKIYEDPKRFFGGRRKRKVGL
jgi:hypothetical protein